MNELVEVLHNLLNHHTAQATKSYLDSRLSEESQAKFSLGYFPPISNLDILTSIIDNKFLLQNKLIFQKNIEDSLSPRSLHFGYFDNHPLIIPCKDVYGNTVGLIGRCILSESERQTLSIDKYKNTFFPKSNHLFGLFESKESILKKGFAYVVEGQIDVIKAHEKGITNIVAIGSANMSSKQFSLLSRYTENVSLLLDNDPAGEIGRKNIISKFGKYANINNVYIPKNFKDIDEYLALNVGTILI